MTSNLSRFERLLINNPEVDVWLSSLPRGRTVVKPIVCTGSRYCPCRTCVIRDEFSS